jgi:hypothetical protein
MTGLFRLHPMISVLGKNSATAFTDEVARISPTKADAGSNALL